LSGLRRPRWGVWTLYGLCLAAGMYTHLSAGFFFVAHGVVFAVLVIAALLRPRGQMARSYPGMRSIHAYYGFGLGALLTLLLHLPLLDQIRSSVGDVSSSAKTSAMGEWNNPLRTLQEFAGSLDALGPLAPYALVGGLLVLILGAVLVWRRSPLLAAIYLTQIPLSLILLVALSFRIWPRYFFVDIGFAFLCAALGGLALVEAVEKAVRRTPLRRPACGLGIDGRFLGRAACPQLRLPQAGLRRRGPAGGASAEPAGCVHFGGPRGQVDPRLFRPRLARH
jgi:mannosyltransferase